MQLPRQAIVLSIDRISRRCLGCYGHEWIETPNLDRLAVRAVVFDQHFVSPIEADLDADTATDTLEALRMRGVHVHVLTERLSFSDQETLPLDETPWAQLVQLAELKIKQLVSQPGEPWLLWLNAAGISWPCVSVEDFAALYADELQSEEGIEPSPLKVTEAAYAANVTQWDHLLGRLLTIIEQRCADNPPLLILRSLRGEALCESEAMPLSHVDTTPPETAWRLRDELVHTPLLIANATGEPQGSRRQELVQSSDVLPTLCEWFLHSLPVKFSAARSLIGLLGDEEQAWRKQIVLRDSDGNGAIRTNDVLFIQPEVDVEHDSDTHDDDSNSHETRARLYLKPEDVWEISDVAEQHRDLVDQLRSQLIQSLIAPRSEDR